MDFPENRSEIWVEEKHHEIMGLRFRVRDTLFSQKSPFQQIDIVETDGHGRLLLIDGVFMLSEIDEFVYHEMIAHVPLFVHPHPRRVLIIGGGDGGTLRETVRHDAVESCTMVEIDPVVVDACRQHLKQTSCAMDHPKARILIEDGVKFMERCAHGPENEKYDVILVDSTDPVGPAEPLFGQTFFQNVKSSLRDDGIVVTQAESCFYEPEWQKVMFKNMALSFDRVHAYNYSNLTYPGALWAFSFASKSLCPIRDFDPARVRQSGMAFKYYNADIHRASFALPSFQRKLLGEFLAPLAAGQLFEIQGI